MMREKIDGIVGGRPRCSRWLDEVKKDLQQMCVRGNAIGYRDEYGEGLFWKLRIIEYIYNYCWRLKKKVPLNPSPSISLPIYIYIYNYRGHVIRVLA